MFPNRLIAQRLSANTCRATTCDCHLWVGLKDRHGYGTLKYNGKMVRAHRLAWMATRGEIPEGMHVLHKCDVRLCINPDHLFLGTNADNMRDRDQKGRHWSPAGEAHYAAKLTEDVVRAIRASAENGVIVGRRYGISHKYVSDIRLGKKWKHVSEGVAP
jgi:hypothetical protein